MILDEIQKAGTVLLLGYGREGQSTERFLRTQLPDLKIEIADQLQDKHYLEKLKNHRVIIKTPGISPHLPEIVAAKQRGVVFTSSTQLFFELCKGKIIGVTGTKGKSTTSTLIYRMLYQAFEAKEGIKAEPILLGNIGLPSLQELEKINLKTWVVFELSSHQLMDLTISPHIAVVLNIFPEHLDYYSGMEEYISAKLRITQFQKSNDTLIYIAKNQDIVNKIEALSTVGAKQALSVEKIWNGPWNLPPGENPLLGVFNLENEAAAWSAAAAVAKECPFGEDKILQGLKTFHPVEHRLELIGGGPQGGINFYDDALATIPEATIGAIQALGPQVQTIFLGGSNRGQNFSELGHIIFGSQIKNVVLFPDTGKSIWKKIQGTKKEKREINKLETKNMDEAVDWAFQKTEPGKSALMSTASPSFSIFKDYRDKANQYRAAIKKYAKYAALRDLPMTPTAATKPTSRKSSTTGKT